MKLPEHVDKLRDLIEVAFDKYFARLGISKNKQLDIEKLPSEVRTKRMRFEEMLENHIGETGNYEHARGKLIDELTFTLFNRLAAVKVMEAAALFPPVLTKQPEHGDRSFGHKAWLEMNPHMRSEELEGIREYLKHAFNELGETLPLYSKAYPYALLPDAISLNEIIDTFNAVEKDTQVGSDIWQSDDILGWMYESYNNVKKKAHKDSGAKTEYHKVSLQSQVYTPRWVVQFLVENSLGKLYLEMYPNSEIKERYKIANAPQTQERKPKLLHELKVIDPACGSGNFLLYAFDFFYELYVDQIENYGADYDEKDIPKLIIENNLHGIDLDDRAVQLAQLGLFIKAKKKRRTISELAFNVVSSDFYLPDYAEVEHIFTEGNKLDKNQQELISDVWSDLQYAYKFGSLIRLDEKLKSRIHDIQNEIDAGEYSLFTTAFIEEEKIFAATFFSNLKTAVEQYAQAKGSTFLTSKTRDAITFLELLTTEYDVATANPPYTDSADFGPELKKFIEVNYKKPYKFHTNLYAAFIKRCYELVNENGMIAMISPRTFMYIKTFESIREYILLKSNVNLLAELEMGGVFEFSNVAIDAVMYVFEKGFSDSIGVYFDLKEYHNYTKKGDIFQKIYNNYINGIQDEHVYRLNQSKLKIIKSWPFIYWISDEFREKFENVSIDKFFKVSQGMSVSNGERFLRFNWELNSNDIFRGESSQKSDWARFPKGGPFKKWSGNLWLCVNWKNDGAELKSFKKAVLRNQQYYFVEGLTYSSSGSKGTTFRTLPSSAVISGGGPGIHQIDTKYSNFYCLGYLNSKLVSYIINCLNPTVNTTQGDLNRIPLLDIRQTAISHIESLVERNIQISDHLLSYSIIEDNYTRSPLFFKLDDFKASIKSFFWTENHLLAQSLINEAIIDGEILSNVTLPDIDKAMVLAKEGESIGGLPVLAEAREVYLAETEATKEYPLDTIRDFIESLPTREFTAEECEEIESGFPTLYQKNNDLEEFCIRHQVNPINVWYWFKQSNVIPQQRMHTLAIEFLADMVREILMEDEDGIVPLVPNAGEKVLLDRIEGKFREKGFSTAQYSSFDTVLGRSIHEYLNKFFFAELSDHLNLFMYLPKTPFIWHLSSGPEQGFDCYIIIYKWSRDKLLRLRSVYIEHRERSLVNRQSDLAGNESAEAQNEKDRIFRQLKEIEAFKVKIDELLAEGYSPVLDDGVGKNIAPLQKKRMIPYEVLNAGQLKKYLNADW
ncbi:BREX-1 system adenine-specific DNA-methyltransferase PglX [Bacillus anthracis]|uniref:BREX-1 system adenine-specific DNA-methyltransferase PglX n=1 Tax=Bacillus TaxID=1386 RepID=UPI0008FE4B1D|nr:MULTISPECIES: BREX-1 system adenine-specific DNA-methyltransferase PglX [Bacillus]MBL3852438.1 BREX-1 system adenine-specific DNA-methyltransferase PglX [Bacillus cereus]MDR4410054.1 BREX-1 system adenine-specific DNA-methyltransferase PglX [Bacillus anthracis]OJE21762.1 restriction endonuclease [Bacillus paranthracis]TSI15279.1 BREX-1 system adenine-specific DNA-methyltransferase PglX [Bacillus sp. HY001]